MKVLIKKRFRDVDTGQIMYVGNTADYERERAHKLARSGFVQMLDKYELPSEPEEDQIETPEKVEVAPPSKRETDGIPHKNKRGRKPKK